MRPALPRRTAALSAAALGILALALAGCRERPPAPTPATTAASEQPRRGGTAVVAVTHDIQRVNELLPGGSQFNSDLVQRLLFLTLLEEQADYAEHPPTFAPLLAERHEWSPDHLVLTFHLRRDVRWSDGQPVTAEDVRWTWQAQTHPDVAWDYAFAKEAIRDVEVVDPHTVRFHFTRAYLGQLTDANEGVVLPRHAWSRLAFAEWRDNADWFRQNLVVDGPFTLASWTPQQEIVVRRNDGYFEPGLPRLDGLVFRVVPDQGNQMAQLLAGSLDYVEQVPPPEAARVQAAPATQLLAFWTRQYTFVVWNTRRAPFVDPEVRRALTLAIDRQAIVDSLWYGYARVGSSPILATVWAHNPAVQPWPYDPAEARRLLDASGWRDGDGDGVRERQGVRFSFDLLTNTGNRSRADTAVMIQEHLRRVGVEARPRQVEFNAFVAQSQGHDFDAAIHGFAIDTSLDLTYAFHSESATEGSNYGSYADPEVDRLLEEIRNQPSPLQARPALYRLQEIVHREQPFTFLWEPQRLDGASRRLRDPRPNALSSYFNVRTWWLHP